eukprot:765521-Hanusia_phi.AAC.15
MTSDQHGADDSSVRTSWKILPSRESEEIILGGAKEGEAAAEPKQQQHQSTPRIVCDVTKEYKEANVCMDGSVFFKGPRTLSQCMSDFSNPQPFLPKGGQSSYNPPTAATRRGRRGDFGRKSEAIMRLVAAPSPTTARLRPPPAPAGWTAASRKFPLRA